MNKNRQTPALFVSLDGDDDNPGTGAAPLRTLERARDRLREIRRAGSSATQPIVWLHGGVYCLDKGLDLTSEDGGTEEAPVTWRAVPGEEVRLMGGRIIRNFTPVTDPEVFGRLDEDARRHVQVADLGAQGIHPILHECPWGSPIPTEKVMELFCDGRRMTLARWPNDGFALLRDVQPKDGNEKGDFRLVYEGDRPTRWKKEDDIWLFGYWHYNWAEDYQKVGGIDTDTHAFILHPPHHRYKYSAPRRYFALNILAELDSPGEWFLERKTGRLYFWPPAPEWTGEVVVTLLAEPLVKLEGASHVRLEGLTFECSRSHGVRVHGGEDNQIAGCVFRHLGSDAVVIDEGQRHGVQSCDIHDVGGGGVILRAGDRKTLSPGNCFADNNHIWNYALLARTYRPGVRLEGVGNRVTHNLIHDAPHEAIQLSGNEHRMEFNEVHHVVTECDDCGAFYMGRDCSERGNIIRYNFFHHLGGFAGGDWRVAPSQDPSQIPAGRFGDGGFHSEHPAELNAVYFDDLASGNTVVGNLFYRAGRGVRIAGGRDVLVENNIFVECNPAVEVTGQGLTWSASYWNGQDNTLIDRLKAVAFDKPPYSERYPALVTLLGDNPGAPTGNRVIRNISVDSLWCTIYWGISLDKHDVHFEDNLVDGDPGFVARPGEDPRPADFELSPDSPACKLGFQRIPVEQIGLVRDEHRRRFAQI